VESVAFLFKNLDLLKLRPTREVPPVKIHWVRILIAAIVAELLVFMVYLLALQYARSELKIIAFLNFFGWMFLGGLWVTRKAESRYFFHGIMVGIVASVLYILCCLPWILGGRVSYDYGIGAFQSAAIKIPASAAGGFIGMMLKISLKRGRYRR
jgi:hypothetical protein